MASVLYCTDSCPLSIETSVEYIVCPQFGLLGSLRASTLAGAKTLDTEAVAASIGCTHAELKVTDACPTNLDIGLLAAEHPRHPLSFTDGH